MTYTTLAEIRDLGLTSDLASDGKVNSAIALVDSLIDRYTRQWFEPRTVQFFFDGSDSDTAHFNVPIISIEWLKINSSTTALDASLYKVYAGNTVKDDRKNPRICLKQFEEYRDIYTAPLVQGRLRFLKGRQTNEVRGVFGYVEQGGLTPEPIKEAARRMVIERLANPAYVAPGTAVIPPPPIPTGGVVIEEWTDGHRLKFANVTASSRSAGIDGITKDLFAQDVLKAYKGPQGIAVPAQWSY